MPDFDYIVVGAGSAGAVVASRLTEDPGVRVLLIEAGKETNKFTVRMPIAFPLTHKNPELTRFYHTQEGPHLGNRNLMVPAGMGIGGSSAINGMIYTRGHWRDYEQWRDLGLPGWGYPDVLPYFKKLENSWRGASEYHGVDGPIRVTQAQAREFHYEALEAAAVAAGHKRAADPYGADDEGVSRLELTAGGGVRSDTGSAYLGPARRRGNLKILTSARTSRVLFEGRRATGVEYIRDGIVERVHAKREVIVSCGALASPSLLLHSGVGPAEELRQLGIEPTLDSPGVGRNLQDHATVAVVWKSRSSNTFLRHLRYDRAMIAAARWAFFRNGPFTNNGCYATIYMRTQPGLDQPDVQIITSTIGLDSTFWFPVIRPSQPHRFWSGVGLMHPKSRGAVKLRSREVDDAPLIVSNMLSDQDDMDTIVHALRALRKIFEQAPQRDLVDAEMAPGADVQSTEDLEAYARQVVMGGAHPVGTCAMGTGNDAVLDAQLRVRGIEGLRVADASVMPIIVGGNTNVPTIMIGEKAADLIRGRSAP